MQRNTVQVSELYLDDAGEHLPDYSEPIDYDEHRWGVPYRDETSGGMPTISVCRVSALQMLDAQKLSSVEIAEVIAHALAADTAAQRTNTGHGRLAVRVGWALSSLCRSGYIESGEKSTR